MKKFTLLCLSVAVSLLVNAQIISPSTTGVYCPGVSITFNVKVPGSGYSNPFATGVSDPNVYGSRALAVTSGVSKVVLINDTTLFTFTGYFVDYASPQEVALTYIDGGGNNQSATFRYDNITSFNLGSGSASLPPQVTPTSIQIPSCQVQSTNFVIAKLQYVDAFVSANTYYGTVTSFQYLLPAGWQLGGVVSDGTTWLTGTANATITSDATHGGTIQVRGAPCSANQLAGAITSIPITRPAPTPSYSITGASTLCSGATSNYSVGVLQAGSTVAWSASPAGLVTIASPNATATDVTYAGTGVVTLVATVTDPCGNVAATNVSVTTGIPTPTISVTTYPAPAYAFAATATYIPGATYAWYLDGQQGGGNSQAYTDIVDCGTRNTLYVQVTNSCGTATSRSTLVYIVCSGGGGRIATTADTTQKITKALSPQQHVNISPNPTPGTFTVSTGVTTNSKIFQIRVVDELGRIRGLFNYPAGVSVTTLNLTLGNGLYILQTYDHNSWSSHFLLIQK